MVCLGHEGAVAGVGSGAAEGGVALGSRMMCSWHGVGAPFVEHNVARLNKLLGQAMNEVEGTAVISEAEECAGQGAGGQFVPRVFGDMYVCHATENSES